MLGEVDMNYLLILLCYLLTLITTFTIRGINKYLLIIDLATEFYKINIDEMGKSDDIEEFNFKKVDFRSFIPIYNIIKSCLSLYNYNKNCPSIVDDLEINFLVCPMAQFEKYEYMKNPSIINLFKVLIQGYKRLNNANFFQAIDNDGYEDGKVYYEGNTDITILDSTGIFEEMTKSQIIEIIKTNDGNHQFSNFVHDDGKNIIEVSQSEEVKAKIDETNEEKRLDKLSKLKELKEYYLTLIAKEKEEKGKEKSIGSKKIKRG